MRPIAQGRVDWLVIAFSVGFDDLNEVSTVLDQSTLHRRRWIVCLRQHVSVFAISIFIRRKLTSLPMPNSNGML